jgi:F0F1-type ATP synthase membrane subunit a
MYHFMGIKSKKLQFTKEIIQETKHIPKLNLLFYRGRFVSFLNRGTKFLR